MQRHTRRHVARPPAGRAQPHAPADVPAHPAVRPSPVPVHRRRQRPGPVLVVQRRHVRRVHRVQQDRLDQ